MAAHRSDPPPQLTVYRIAFEGLHALCLVYLLCIELGQLFRHVTLYGHPFAYLFDLGQLIDVACLLTQAMALRTYHRAYAMSLQMFASLDTTFHYDAIQNLMAFGRITAVTRDMARFQRLLSDFAAVDQMRKVRIGAPRKARHCLARQCLCARAP